MRGERGNEVNVFFLLVYGERKYCGEIPFSFSDFLAFGKGHLKKRTWKKKKKNQVLQIIESTLGADAGLLLDMRIASLM